MKKTVAVVDYGMGNLRSVTQAVMHVAADSGVAVVWARTPQEVMAADRVVLPGQGGMRDCMRELHESGMYGAVMHAAQHKPLMGVCGHANAARSQRRVGYPMPGSDRR